MKVRAALSAREAPRPALARAEIIDKATRGRFEAELETALKRKSSHEGKLGGALRAVASLSPALRAKMTDAAATMVRRKSFSRELYVACIRSVAEAEDRHVAGLLRAALSSDEAGGNAALSAACFSTDPELGSILAKLAGSRQSHLAFGAETARVVRGESNGAHLTSLAPMIKESHRIALCVELFVPLARSGPPALRAAPALTVLRGAERHLGRWLVLAEVAARSGDPTPLAEARALGAVGPSSARAAWSLVGWALSQRSDLDRPATSAANGASILVSRSPAPTLGSAERGSRHDVSLSDGSRKGPERKADARDALEDTAPWRRRGRSCGPLPCEGLRSRRSSERSLRGGVRPTPGRATRPRDGSPLGPRHDGSGPRACARAVELEGSG